MAPDPTWACKPPHFPESRDLAPPTAHRRFKQPLLAVAGLWALCLTGAATGDVLLDDILRAADQGECIESVTFRMIQQQGPAQAGVIVQTSLRALAQCEQQQRALGCPGNIAAQAIAAGADPEEVLEATAAGL